MQPVRKELELRELQIEMLGDLETDMSDMSEQILDTFFNNDPREDPRIPRGSERSGRRTQDRRKAIQKINSQGEKLAKVILDSDQTKRFSQVHLQYEGTRALGRQPFRDQLGVTDEQYKEIRGLLPPQDDRSTLGRPEKNLDQSVMALLSKEQQVKLKELRGKPFEFPLRWSPWYRRSR